MVLAVLSSPFTPLADGFGAHAKALGQHARRLSGTSNLTADSGSGTGTGMKGEHHILQQRGDGRPTPSKRQVYSSIAQRTRSQQRSATKQLVLQAQNRDRKSVV